MPMPPASPAGDDAAHPVHPAPSASPPDAEGVLLGRLHLLIVARQEAIAARRAVIDLREPDFESSDEVYLEWRRQRRRLPALQAAVDAARNAVTEFQIANHAALTVASAHADLNAAVLANVKCSIIEAGPNDVLVLKFRDDVSEEMLVAARQALAATFPGRRTLVLTRGASLSIADEATAARVKSSPSDPARPPTTLREVVAWCERRGLSLDVPLFVFDDVEGNDVWARLDEAESGIDGLVFVQDGKASSAGGAA